LIDTLILKIQEKAQYSIDSNSHFGLNFTSYVHFTSPIRRYADLIVHRILKTNSIPIDINKTILHLNKKEKRISLIENYFINGYTYMNRR